MFTCNDHIGASGGGGSGASKAVSWISIVVETSGLNYTLGNVSLQLHHMPAAAAKDAAAGNGFDVWRTCEGEMFRKMSTVPLSGPDGDTIHTSFEPRCIYTLVTAAAHLGADLPANRSVPGSASFPDTWSDNFDSYSDQQTVKYFTDESGSFNAARPPARAGIGDSSTTALGGKMVLQQAVLQPPINGAWWGNSNPNTILGNSQNWTNTTVEVDALIAGAAGKATQPAEGYAPLTGALLSGHDLDTANLSWTDAVAHCNASQRCVGFTFDSPDPQPPNPVHVFFKSASAADTDAEWHSWVKQTPAGGGSGGGPMPGSSFVQVCARISVFKPSGEPPQGYCLVVDADDTWWLTFGLPHHHLPNLVVLASGPLEQETGRVESHGGDDGRGGGKWRRLRLDVIGDTVTGMVDGVQVGSVVNATLGHGMVAVGSGWHLAYFDNFTVNATQSEPTSSAP